MREQNLAGFQALGVDDVFFGGEDEPDGELVFGVGLSVGVGEKALRFCGGGSGKGGATFARDFVGLDFGEEGSGGTEGLGRVEFALNWRARSQRCLYGCHNEVVGVKEQSR